MMFLAKDMQVAGAEIRGYATATRKAAPEMGQIHAAQVYWRGHRTSIEVLERLPGLDEGKAFPTAGHALVGTNGLCLLDPCSLFICKLHAANTRPTEAVNNDLNHLRILARVIPRLLAKVKAAALVDYDAREDAERLLRKVEAYVRGDDGFQVPLAAAELELLVQALREHLA